MDIYAVNLPVVEYIAQSSSKRLTVNQRPYKMMVLKEIPMSAAVDWNQRRINARMGIPNAALPVSAILPQPARPGPTMASDWQRRKAAEMGTSIPSGATQGQAASIIKTAMAKEAAAEAVRRADQIHLDACMARFDRACGL